MPSSIHFSSNLTNTVALHVEGNAAIDVVGLLTINGSFALDQFDASSLTFAGAGATGLALRLQLSGGVPSGAVSGSGTLQLVQVTNTAGLSWLGVEATDLSFSLDFAPLSLAVTNGVLRINQAPVGQSRVNWSTVSGLPSSIHFSSNLTNTVALHVEGNAAIDVVGLLTINGSFALDQFDASSLTFAGAGATGLALRLQLSGGVPSGAVSGSGTLQLVQVTNTAGLSWLGVEATDLSFSLDFAPLSLAVTNGVLRINQAPVGQSRVNWSTVSGLPSSIHFSSNLTNTVALHVEGNAAIDVVGLLTINGSFALDQFDASSLTFAGAGATGLALRLQLSGGVPSGAVSGSGTLQLVQVTNTAGLSWLGVEATDLSFSLDFAPLSLAVTNGVLRINQAPVGQSRVNWSTVSGLPSSIHFSSNLTNTVALHVEGNAAIDVVGLLTINGSFALDQFDASSLTFAGAGATGLALRLQLSGGVPSGAVSGSGTLQLVQVTNTAGLSWLGVEATDLSFSLDFAPLSLAVTNGVLRINQAPVGQSRVDWSTVTGLPSSIDFSSSLTNTVALHVEGNAAIDVVGLLPINGSFALDQFDASSLTFAGAGATVLALRLQLSGSFPFSLLGAFPILQLVQVTNTAGLSWLGVEATDLS